MISSGQVTLLDDYSQTTDFGPFDTAVLITLQVYSALASVGPPPVAGTNGATMQLFKGIQGQEQPMPEISIGPPGVYQYANAHGFRMRNQIPGAQAYYQAQAWFPNEPIALTQVGSAAQTINPNTGGVIVIPCCGGGGGSFVLTVTDGITTVTPVTEVDFTSGAVVTDLGGGIAGVDVTGTGLQYEVQPQPGGWFYGTTTNAVSSPNDYGWDFEDNSNKGWRFGGTTAGQFLVAGGYLTLQAFSNSISSNIFIQENLTVDVEGTTGLTFKSGGSGAAYRFQDTGGNTYLYVTNDGSATEMQLAAGGTFTLRDHLGNPILQMTEGSPDLHIPAGGTVVADL